MRKSISEMAKLSGVSVRTLHYYDEINLLKPSEVIPETGYRYYDEQDLLKLQQILFYRELDFPLKDIIKIMNTPEYDQQKAMHKQEALLILKRNRLDKIIELLHANLKGDTTMSFKEFDTTEIENAKEKYAKEVAERWGNSDAYKQSQKKTESYSKDDWKRVSEHMDALLQKFAGHVGEDAGSEAVQALVMEWQQYITDTYYDCTRDILAGLGQMYVADERFTGNMDKFQAGTAQLMSEAIAIYCR